MEEERKIVLDGFITLEVSFLEKLWAAYLLTRYEKVCERYETGGDHHDVLTQSYDASTLYECTGQQQMTSKKIDKLAWDSFLIKDAIQKEGEPPLKKVCLVAALNRNSWSNEVKEAFDITHRDLGDKGLTFERVDDYDVLYPLLYEGILGFAFIQNRLYPLGPEEHGIRYDKDQNMFINGLGLSVDDMVKFKRLPHSFLPSLYWGTFYRKLLEDSTDETELPFVFDNYSYNFGIKWKNAGDMRQLYKQTSYVQRYAEPEDYGNNAFVHTSWSKKHSYHSAYVFDCSDVLNRDKVSELLGLMQRAIRSYREKKQYPEMERIGGELITSSEDWSPRAWWEARKTSREDIYISRVLRGSALLTELLNEGILGFAFADIDYAGNVISTTNQIKLVGPGIPAMRLKNGELLREPES